MFWPLLFLFLCPLLAQPVQSRRRDANQKKLTIVWTQDDDDQDSSKRIDYDDDDGLLSLRENDESNNNNQPKRRWICLSKPFARGENDKSKRRLARPHELRTDVWELKLKWKRNRGIMMRRGQSSWTQNLPPDLTLEFADNGFVRQVVVGKDTTASCDGSSENNMSSNTQKDTLFAIGTWSSSVNGVSWHLQPRIHPNQKENDSDEKSTTTTLEFHGQLLLNTFGSQPRIIRGVVLEIHHPDNDKSGSSSNDIQKKNPLFRPWFRPIVGTFTGDGVGEDTADLSYKGRVRR